MSPARGAVVRVLFISDVYFPRINGVSTSIATFRADLGKCGVETTLVVPAYGPSDPVELGVVRVPSRRVPGDPEDRRMLWRDLLRALASCARHPFDLVHIHTPFVAHYAGVRHARAARAACLATYHTFFEGYLHHYAPLVPPLVGRAVARAVTRAQCREVDAVIAPSEPLRAALIEYGVTTPIHVVPTGLPADRFAAGDGRRFRELHRLPSGRPLLLYAGRVAHEKNIEFLIRCHARVKTEAPQSMLVIAGEGPAERRLRRLAAQLGLREDVRFVGYLDRDRTLRDAYAAAQAFLFASRTETQGLVLLEAMAQGTPVVSTAALGTRSVLEPRSGAIVAPERIEDFAAAIVRLLQDESLRRQKGQRGIAFAETWSSRAMAERLAALYRAAVTNATRRPPRATVICASGAARGFGLHSAVTVEPDSVGSWRRSVRWWWTTRSPRGCSSRGCSRSTRSTWTARRARSRRSSI